MRNSDNRGKALEYELCSMALHETIGCNIEGMGSVYITRVVTGWIYSSMDLQSPQRRMVPIFIPLTTYSSPAI